MGIRRGTVGGSLILRKRFCLKRCFRFDCVNERFGSIKSPKFRLRLEIYGNGWLESTDCGVRIGKRLSRKYLSSCRFSFTTSELYDSIVMPAAARAGNTFSFRYATCRFNIGRK